MLKWGSLLGIGGVLYLKVWLPLTGIGIPCVFREATHLFCPGCGMTRASLSILSFDFHQAFRYNSLVFVLIPIYIVYRIAQRKQMRRTSFILMTAMLIMTIGFGVLRNIPAFDWLAPTRL